MSRPLTLRESELILFIARFCHVAVLYGFLNIPGIGDISNLIDFCSFLIENQVITGQEAFLLRWNAHLVREALRFGGPFL